MSISVQPRGGRFQLRVRHALLPKPFFFTFAADAEAREYGRRLVATLDAGHVPVELQRQVGADDPLLIEVIRAYSKGAPHLTESDDKLLGAMLAELVDVRLSMVTYAWAERYVRDLKVRAKLAPGSIRKRCGALARVIDWRLRSTNSTAANALRLLPTGYSHYTAHDRAALGPRLAPIDVHRDRRLAPGEEAKILPHLGDLDLLFLVIVNTGLRLREAYRLRVDQVDIDRGVLRVEGTKGARGALKPRVVPMMPGLRKALYAHCAGRVGLLFPFWNGDPTALKATTSRLSYLFGKAFRHACVDDLTEHDLRHEAACRWFTHRTGSGWTFSDIEVARIMGWSSLSMALRYASLRGEDMAKRLQ